MGTVERRERERDEIRRKIVDAARELFVREGYDRVTMRRIAEAIEYSATTIYNHFKDKDDLLEALCHEDFARLLEALRTQPHPTSGVAQIRQLGLAYAQFGLSHPNHYRFMFLTPANHIDGHELSAPGQRSFELLRQAVQEAIDQGELLAGDAITMAQVMWASLHGVVALLITYRPEQFPQAPAAPDLVAQVMENGIRGFLAPIAAPAPASARARRR